MLKKFIRFYEFLLQATSFTDEQLHMKYNYICWLLPFIKMGRSGKGFDLVDKIQATNFYQKRGKEENVRVVSDPSISLAKASKFNLTDDEKKKLSDIIREVNEKTGKSFDNDVAIRAALQIKDLMMKNEELRASAKNNSIDNFSFAYFDNIDDVLIDGRNQNQEFFDLLLNNDNIRNDILGIFIDEIYKNLRGDK